MTPYLSEADYDRLEAMVRYHAGIAYASATGQAVPIGEGAGFLDHDPLYCFLLRVMVGEVTRKRDDWYATGQPFDFGRIEAALACLASRDTFTPGGVNIRDALAETAPGIVQ